MQPFIRSGPPELKVTHTAPHVRKRLSAKRMMACVVLALVPCFLMALYTTGYQANLALAELSLAAAPGWRGTVLDAVGVGIDSHSLWASSLHGALYLLPSLAVALAVGAFWEEIFASLRKRKALGDSVVTVLIFTLFLPPAVPLWQVALGISFGIVIGKEIFGGTGKNFVNPALVGLVFLYLAYPNELADEPIWSGISGYGGTTIFSSVAAAGMDAVFRADLTWRSALLGFEQGALGETSAVACLIGGAYLVYSGVASWRIMVGVCVGGVATALVFNLIGGDVSPIFAMPWYWHLVLGGFAFGAVFLATDPVSAAATDTGRWIYGLLIGAMIILVRVGNTAHPDGVMMAVLLGNIFAPLIDYGVVWANIRRRARRGA